MKDKNQQILISIMMRKQLKILKTMNQHQQMKMHMFLLRKSFQTSNVSAFPQQGN